MKLLLQSLFFFLLVSQICFAQWYQQQSGTDAMLNAVFFLDSLNGWVAGEDSTILFTTNGGQNWNSISIEGNYKFKDICFINDSTGWIVGRGGFWEGVVLYTSNKGQSWINQGNNIHRYIYAISLVDDTIGYLSGGISWPGAGIILKTENAGTAWKIIHIDEYQNGNNFYDIDFVNQDIGWVVGGINAEWGNVIKKTTDGGENWITQYESTLTVLFSSCDFINQNTGWVTFEYSAYINILFTQNGGIKWTAQHLPDTSDWYNLKSIFFISEEKGWCVGDKFLSNVPDIFYTSDAGSTWNQQYVSAQQNSILNSVYFINDETGWVVGDNGLILHTTTGGVSFVEKEQVNEIPTEFLLSQNYPNPFNPSTKLKYSISQTSEVQIKVFDVLGNEIETLVNEEKPAGTYELTWNAASLPSGVYFYQLKAVDPSTGSGQAFIETKKMILLR